MKIRPQLIELEDIFDSPTLNQTALKMLILSLNAVQGNVTIANNAAGDIRRPLMGINMAAFLNVSLGTSLLNYSVLSQRISHFHFRKETSGN